MYNMGILGIFILAILAFIFFGILGWIIKLFEYVFDFLFDGCLKSAGYIVMGIIIFLILVSLI